MPWTKWRNWVIFEVNDLLNQRILLIENLCAQVEGRSSLLHSLPSLAAAAAANKLIQSQLVAAAAVIYLTFAQSLRRKR